jgi:hypothetical protein
MRQITLNTIVIEWGIPESDGGAIIEGYTIAIRDSKKTMWMEVGSVGADVQKLTVKDLQVMLELAERIWLARNYLKTIFISFRRVANIFYESLQEMKSD